MNGDDAQEYASTTSSKANESHGVIGEKETDTSKLSDLDLSKNSKDTMPPKADDKK